MIAELAVIVFIIDLLSGAVTGMILGRMMVSDLKNINKILFGGFLAIGLFIVVASFIAQVDSVAKPSYPLACIIGLIIYVLLSGVATKIYMEIL